MTSAEALFAPRTVLVTVWLQPAVESEMVMVKDPAPLAVTEADIRCPGVTALEKYTGGAG